VAAKLLLSLGTTPLGFAGGGGEQPKAGDMLAYLFTDCALASACAILYLVGDECVEMAAVVHS
jgi:hypothetical protein